MGMNAPFCLLLRVVLAFHDDGEMMIKKTVNGGSAFVYSPINLAEGGSFSCWPRDIYWRTRRQINIIIKLQLY